MALTRVARKRVAARHVYFSMIVGFVVLLSIYLLDLLSGYVESLIIFFMVYIALAISYSILAGYAGETSFGIMGFFGVGGYVVAMLGLYTDVGFPFNFIIGGLIAGLLALTVAYPLLRIRGWYFAVGTWAFAEILRTLIQTYSDFTKGAAGVFVRRPEFYDPTINYVTALVVGFSIIALFYRLINSKVGLAFRSIRDNYDAAKMMGINTTLYRTLAFVISSFIAGLAGGYFAIHKGYIDPGSAFDPSWMFKMIVMSSLGGTATFLGPILGSGIVLVLEEIGRTYFLKGYLLLLALTLVVVFLFMPGGIVGAINKNPPIQNPYRRLVRLKRNATS